MSGRSKSLLVVKHEKVLVPEIRVALNGHLESLAERLGFECILMDGGLDAELYSDLAPLLEKQLEQQQETNRLLGALVSALSEEDEDPDAERQNYMDGSPAG